MSSPNNGFQNSSYSSDKGLVGAGDAEVSADPASNSFFSNEYKRHDDLKTMLDCSKDHLKLEAMKRIIGHVARGKDVSDLFPAVVKNVVSKNIEVKKLVYVYLVRYAEEQQDLALLSISTFQRALKDPNQLIRASALRVLSSIRVSMIVPIMMLAIKDSVTDMSPYVRKTAAHAIPKMYVLDPEQKNELILVIEKLLSDKTTLVVGSALQAFEEVCPERIDLIHKSYRKLCNLLVDVEEWGQVVIINTLTRYCRMQFVNPNKMDGKDEGERDFYESDSSKEEREPEKKEVYSMDPDHRLLLRMCKPLLNSRNAAVVMAVVQLYFHCAPKVEVGLVVRSLIRLLRSHKEVQFIVLSNIAAISHSQKNLFEPYLKSFYIRSSDPLQAKLLKLDILTNLANKTNISTLLREFQTYVRTTEQEFAAATIQAIGRCATVIEEVTNTCLAGLVSLLSNQNEAVVGESVIVIRKLLQMRVSAHHDIIAHLAKLVESITVPMARASILWLIGEYSDKVPKIAPDVLRKLAKTFVREECIVKLQTLNLAAKLLLTNPGQTKQLAQYVFQLAKYDQNYDIRDRARLLRQLVMPGDAAPLAKHAKRILLAQKPAPVLVSKYQAAEEYQLGTLSHTIHSKATGYQSLPEWPETAPDASVRNIVLPDTVESAWLVPDLSGRSKNKAAKKADKSFYSSSSSSDSQGNSDDESSSSGGSTESSSSEESSGSEEEEEEEKLQVSQYKKAPEVACSWPNEISKGKDSTDEGSEDDTSSSSSSEESTDDSSEEEVKSKTRQKQVRKPAKSAKIDCMLLDLDSSPSVPTAGLDSLITPMSGLAVLQPLMASSASTSDPSDNLMTSVQPNYANVAPAYVPVESHLLLNKIAGHGLVAHYRFTRLHSMFCAKMTSIELTLQNQSDDVLSNIAIGKMKLVSDMKMKGFSTIESLEPGQSVNATIGIDFKDTIQPAQFDLCTSERNFSVAITAPVGELLKPQNCTEKGFSALRKKLTGMAEVCSTLQPPVPLEPLAVSQAVMKAANVCQVAGSDDGLLMFAGQTVSELVDALVTAKLAEPSVRLTVNCEKMVVGSMLLKEIKAQLA